MFHKKGYILVLTLIIMAALLFFGTLLLSLYQQEAYIVQKAETDMIAEEAAKAGIAEAIYNLREDPNWMTGFNNVKLPASGATYTITVIKDKTPTPSVPYSINNYNNSSSVKGWQGRDVPSSGVHLVSAGKIGRSQKIIQTLALIQGPGFSDTFQNGTSQWIKTNNVNVRGTKYDIIQFEGSSSLQMGPGSASGNYRDSEHQMFASNLNLTDFDISLKLRLVPPSVIQPQYYGYSIMFRATNTNDVINAYSFQFEMPNNKATSSFMLTKIAGIQSPGSVSPVSNITPALLYKATGDPFWDPLKWNANDLNSQWYKTHNIGIKAAGNVFTIYMDGRQVLTFTDTDAKQQGEPSDFITPYKSGTIGFRTWYDSAIILDDISVVVSSGGSVNLTSQFH
ncbi:MAG: family 16 glycoside hydrolase [Candidatus Eremiobacterota bacterium]